MSVTCPMFLGGSGTERQTRRKCPVNLARPLENPGILTMDPISFHRIKRKPLARPST